MSTMLVIEKASIQVPSRKTRKYVGNGNGGEKKVMVGKRWMAEEDNK